MLSPDEAYEIRAQVHREMADLERQAAQAGTYSYLCATEQGLTFLSHQPVGTVLRHLPPHHIEE